MVISCKIVNSSIKFKFIHKISIIHEKFHVLLNLLRWPDLIPSGAGSGLRVVHPCHIRPVKHVGTVQSP